VPPPSRSPRYGKTLIQPEISKLAAEHLTDRQRQVFNWHLRDDRSFRDIAASQDLARSTVTDAFDAACRKLRKHGVLFTKDGHPYLEETHVKVPPRLSPSA
jgi:DNA-binding CsgD family transcriptional regulator